MMASPQAAWTAGQSEAGEFVAGDRSGAVRDVDAFLEEHLDYGLAQSAGASK